ncbi:MAG: glycine dehydrogenase (aminomethyl-transferring) [gamma proteobacterium symbiont of Ctena orbiculata]|uniref:Probable glycine dehydrogenase (decarboxylating) subunit 1 n=1 Tax=Candidatus Thiodiazotropha taylori TaxID=2792791 RepID=A0A944QRA9_9GAMM|nr:aminomethyl-transferring glycine dehydrogenase subunit GcvPA [Candidatus Thiodiazotropha taylori]MBV2137737.1 aminomethyl-transferring glycine dehydrogenase subunit GcvPA [Candidatus Thiodiazotropha taylori]PUB82648.1 MAG: aminomethyl-transferring glycine dehydrogenase subunit GcvPA [gamma proteobacterium symbiont of Ctena orbiculata]PVV09956.1 MAG: glycine dehydrogenase (aminomethyl-transferring) [gamma proteobacterium symbiont of Ctena orbiculata]PVV13621.1 MAG: glycine dehydrogenase (amin
MPFIPHTEDDIEEMLAAIGVDNIDALFDEIPDELRCGELDAIPPGMSEMELSRLMQARARADGQPLCFIGAGAYDHHIPAAVWELTTRGEFYTAYTPYQAEASQGTLQLLYEYQSMMTALTGMDVSNASLYDGASALAEAVLMAVRANRKSKSKRVLVPRNLHPVYRKVAHTIVRNQQIELVEVAYDSGSGGIDRADLDRYRGEDYAALIIPQPNFFGVLEAVDELTDWAHANGMLAIAVVNPLAMAVLKPAGEWGEQGADICCGEGQPLGAPLASGGPYFGFLCSTQKLVRQMPGRIIGKTVDLDGKPGYALTLQAREQHIRRSKATSNICTNQGLMVTAATIHMSLMGSEGLQRVAAASHANSDKLTHALTSLPGVESLFDGPVFHERVVRLPIAANKALRALAAHNVLGGFDLSDDYPELGDAILVCATELRSEDDIESYRSKLERVIASQVETPCQLKPDW